MLANCRWKLRNLKIPSTLLKLRFERSIADVKECFPGLEKTANIVRFEVKTKMMVQVWWLRERLDKVSWTDLNRVHRRIYVSKIKIMITSDKNDTIEIQNKITVWKGYYNSLLQIVKFRHVHWKTKLLIYKTHIVVHMIVSAGRTNKSTGMINIWSGNQHSRKKIII